MPWRAGMSLDRGKSSAKIELPSVHDRQRLMKGVYSSTGSTGHAMRPVEPDKFDRDEEEEDMK